MTRTSKSWAIIGGGPHGVHAAIRLRHAGVPAGNIHIFDPHRELLARWQHCTAATGMTYLRSPVVHHLAVDPYALSEFAKSREARQFARFVPPYRRPGLPLFQAHCASLLSEYRLADVHSQTNVMALKPQDDGWNIATSRGELQTHHVVLATGGGDSLQRPRWADELPVVQVSHLFDTTPAWRDARQIDAHRIAVIGGGISAAQAALELSTRHHVTLIRRHSPRVHLFDSDPGWVGPLNMRGFTACKDLGQRRSMILNARHRGSMPPELARKLHCKTRLGVLRVVQGEVQAADRYGSEVHMLCGNNSLIVADHVVLATGMAPGRPGGALVDDLIATSSLPVSHCGFPILRNDLSWRPGLFVMGGLAELQVGPTARNIAGAREAATRIINAAVRTVA